MGMAGLNCWECPRHPPLSRSSSSVVASAFVASVPGKDRQSLAFSRWPGRLVPRLLLAVSIGLPLRIGLLAWRIFWRYCRLGHPQSIRKVSRILTAFVASVPGKSRQSLFFGLCGSGFFDLRGIGRSPMASSWVRRSVSGLFSNPPEAVMASGNIPSVFPTAPVGNRMCFPLPAGISVVTFLFPVGRDGWRPGVWRRRLLVLHHWC